MPTPIRWICPSELTAEEAGIAQMLHRIGKFYAFLREIRAELFDDAFQAELAAVYQPRGTAPVPPALLAMVMLLQAYDQVGDAEAVVTADEVSARGVARALDRVLGLWQRPDLWRRVQHAAMARHFGWAEPARHYQQIYRSLVRRNVRRTTQAAR